VFEAVASLRGDVANESVQHRELSIAINKDVLEPLSQLRETADMVVRVVRSRRPQRGVARYSIPAASEWALTPMFRPGGLSVCSISSSFLLQHLAVHRSEARD